MTHGSVVHVGDHLYDAGGHKIGKIIDLISDDQTLQPLFYRVKVGLVKGSHLVPADSVTATDGVATVPFGKEVVGSTPKTKEPALTKEDHEALYAHYGAHSGR